LTLDALAGDGRRAEAMTLLLESRAVDPTRPEAEAFAAAVRDELSRAAPDRAITASVDPARLDLMALASVAGVHHDRAALGDELQSALRHLEGEYRALLAHRGQGRPSRAELAELARSWDAARGLHARGAWSVQQSAVVFRAAAALAEPDLDAQVRAHLSSLFFRQELDRRLYAHLLSGPPPAAREREIRSDAAEVLGRLLQALYNAHLAVRSSQRPDPTPLLTRAMQGATANLLDHLRWLGWIGSSGPPAVATAPLDDPSQRRAATQALRGLRIARTQLPVASASIRDESDAP
jgi:hypothetical protein